MKNITLEHGAGGKAMQNLIKEYVLKYFKTQAGEVSLEALDDSAVIDDIVFTTDSHTIKPLFFPGGNIGTLAVAGTVNDLAVVGAKPLALSSAFVIEEGYPIEKYEKILNSMQEVSALAKVPIITGDTKVMEHGNLEEMIINTSGIGRPAESLENNIQVVKKYRNFNSRWILDSNLAQGDKIILSGSIGDHGIALLSFREGYGFESEVASDITPLNLMIEKALAVGGIVAMKDPTRGGLANTLNEFSQKSRIGIVIDEEKIPIKEPVRAACELLGIDPLEIGNEGKVVLGVVKEKANEVLEALRGTKEGKHAQIIGEASKALNGVVMRTVVGGERIVDTPVGDPVPRIC